MDSTFNMLQNVHDIMLVSTTKNTNFQLWFTASDVELFCKLHLQRAGLGRSVGCALDWWSGGREFEASVRQHSFVEIDHEIFSTVILSLPLI